MFNFINTKKALMLASALTVVGAGAAIAETVTGDASVTVQNSLTLTQDAALSFGTLVAVADDINANFATYVVGSDGTTTTPAPSGGLFAQIIEITAGTPASFTVSGAAPQTLLTVTLPAAAIIMNDGAGGAVDAKEFTVDSFEKTRTVSGGAGFTDTTNDSGVLSFDVGATLATDKTLSNTATAAVPYADANYSGTYSITVTY